MTTMNITRLLFGYRRARRLMWEKWIARCNGMTRACTNCPSSYCCYQLPLSHPMEGVIAAAYLIDNNRVVDIDRAVEQGVRQNKLWRNSFDQMVEAGTMEDASAVAGAGAEEWFELKEPCVFLQADRCSIYPVRPTMCATYFVKDRCTKWIGSTELVPTANNMEVVMAVMDLSDVALSALVGQHGTSAAPTPFAYGVGVGAEMLCGRPVEMTAVERG